MEIRLRPELEAAIREDVQRGAYQTVDDYVEHAVSMLHEQEAWLAAHRAEIVAQIDEGYAAAQRGELLEPDEVRSRLNELKRARPAERRQG
jgi:putative addiction module CopG family antidote